MKHIFAAIALLSLLAWVPLSAQAAPSKQNIIPSIPKTFVQCNVSTVLFSVYSMPITQTESITLNFQSSGVGLVTLVVNNYQTSYSARTDANCGLCALTVPNVVPGPRGILQVSATVAAAACPSAGITASNFVLHVGPPQLSGKR